MNYEIGDSVLFYKDCVKNIFKKGFIAVTFEIKQTPKSESSRNAFMIIEENGKVCTFEKTSIHFFSEKLFKTSRTILCEKTILDGMEVKKALSRKAALELLNTLANRDE